MNGLTALRAFGAASSLVMIAMAGCSTEAVCFDDCADDLPIGGSTSAGGSSSSGGTVLIGGGGAPDGPPLVTDGGAPPLEDAGTSCDDKDLKTDVENCGSCGHHCVITGALAACEKGKCVLDRCKPNRQDLNEDADDGCEFSCQLTNDHGDDCEENEPGCGIEVCDLIDNDCNGVVDDGFDTKTDPENCGQCGRACSLLHATAACAPTGSGENERGTCVVAKTPDGCEPGWFDVNGVDADGCEYQCEYRDAAGEVCSALGVGSCGVESCDTYDNDCDGQINENSPDGGQACSDYCPSGQCRGECSPGQTQCVGTDIVCLPGAGPSLEMCDGLDNDCNGTIDNGFDVDDDVNNCGGCGIVCNVPHAFARCDDGKCVVDQCRDGYANIDASDGAPGCEYACPVNPRRPEACNGLDDDCDGKSDAEDETDVNLSKPRSGSGVMPASNSFCRQRAGSLCVNVPLHCAGADGWVCDYPPGVEATNGIIAVTESSCDGIDGNCDGQIDEAFSLGGACDDGALGVCLDAGKIACDPGDPSKTYCDTSALPDPPAGAPFANETCNNKDDDCDGLVDEDTDGDMAHIQRDALDFMIDKYEASRPDAASNSAGSDESHTCAVSGRLPWASATFQEASDACAASGKRLCTIDELREACEGAADRTYPYGNLYGMTSCNGLDNGANKALKSGEKPACISLDGVFDLSGNVSEWSSTKTGATTSNPSYDIMAVQGGSYLTPQNGLACRFDFAVFSSNAVLPNLGFRCCKDP